ncbi:MAG: lipid asymmetry maintenance protein MlaB [Acidobacteriota bacterium]
MAFELKQTGETVVLRLEGDCTVEHARALHSALADGLIRGERVVLNLEGVTAVDVSCLQLICSAHRTAIASEKQLSFDEVRPEIFMKTAREAGFCRAVGCLGNPGGECLWREGGRR